MIRISVAIQSGIELICNEAQQGTDEVTTWEIARDGVTIAKGGHDVAKKYAEMFA